MKVAHLVNNILQRASLTVKIILAYEFSAILIVPNWTNLTENSGKNVNGVAKLIGWVDFTLTTEPKRCNLFPDFSAVRVYSIGYVEFVYFR